MESKKKYYILLISHTNSEIRIDLPCNSTGLLPANKYNKMLLIKHVVELGS